MDIFFHGGGSSESSELPGYGPGLENHSDGEHFVIVAILRGEKRWAKMRTSAIAYSPIVSAHF